MNSMYRNDEIKDLKCYILNNIIYDPDDGQLWLRETESQPETLLKITDARAANRDWRGRVKINGRRAVAARVAYLLVHGDWAKAPIICLNGCESDIRWTNLWEDETHLAEEMLPPDELPDYSSRLKEINKRHVADLKKHHPPGCGELSIRSRGHVKHYSASAGFIGSPADLCAERPA